MGCGSGNRELEGVSEATLLGISGGSIAPDVTEAAAISVLFGPVAAELGKRGIVWAADWDV